MDWRSTFFIPIKCLVTQVTSEGLQRFDVAVNNDLTLLAKRLFTAHVRIDRVVRLVDRSSAQKKI